MKRKRSFLYFSPDGKKSSLGYHLAFIFDHRLEKYDISLTFLPVPDLFWNAWRRVASSPTLAAKIIRRILRDGVIPFWRLCQMGRVFFGRFEGVIMGPYLVQPSSHSWIETLLGAICRWRRKPLILYLVDALHLPFPKQTKARLDASSHILVANPWLKEAYRSRGKPVDIVRVALDVARYPFPTHQAGDSIVMGFSGNPNNFRYLLEIESVLAEILDEFPQVILQIVSSKRPPFQRQNIRFEFKPWMNEDPYASAFELGGQEMLAFDIGLAPLLDEDYARGKDSCRLRQYMALSLAIVASPVGVNEEVIQDGFNGLLASTKAEWRTQLKRLIADRSFREKLGSNARKTVKEEFDISVQAKILGCVLNQIADQAVRTLK